MTREVVTPFDRDFALRLAGHLKLDPAQVTERGFALETVGTDKVRVEWTGVAYLPRDVVVGLMSGAECQACHDGEHRAHRSPCGCVKCSR